MLAAIAPSLTMGLLMAGCVGALSAAFRLMRFPDVTVEGSFLLGGVMWAAFIQAGAPTFWASLAAIAAGGAAGATTALLTRQFQIDRFLAGILVTTSSYSIALLVLGRSNVGLFDAPGVILPGLDFQDDHGAGAAAFAAGALVAILLFFKSAAGVRARAAAINPQFLESMRGGSLVDLAVGLALTNALAAASGLAVSRYQGFVDVGMGQGILIAALASFAIGEALLRWVSVPIVLHTALAAITGSILYQLALALALMAGVPPASTKVATAGFVLFFLILQYRRLRNTEAPA